MNENLKPFETEVTHLGRPAIDLISPYPKIELVPQSDTIDFLQEREKRLLTELQEVRKMLFEAQGYLPNINYRIYTKVEKST